MATYLNSAEASDVTAYNVGAAITFEGYFYDTSVTPTVPTMYIGGADDATSVPALLTNAYNSNNQDKMLVEATGAGHGWCAESSDIQCTIYPEIKQWLNCNIRDNQSDCDALFNDSDGLCAQ